MTPVMDISRKPFETPPASLRARIEAVLDSFLLEPDPTAEEMAWDELEFRRRVLGICGFTGDDALALALRPELGLKEPLALVEAGCPPHLATRIVL